MVQITRTRLEGAGRSTSRSVATQRWGAVIGGGALAIYGISRRSPLGLALAAGGSTIALLGANRTDGRQPSSWTSLLINSSRRDVYRFWRDFENLPRFMNRLENVTLLDNRRSRWMAIGPGGRPIHWEAEIIDERENEYIAWRSLPGSDVQVDGRVEFQEAPAGRGTLVSLRLDFRSASGMSSTLANFLQKGINFALRQDLRRLEALMEAGEIPTVEGQPHGPRDVITGLMRVADPTRPIRAGSSLREVFRARRRMA
jgi:uncharacterized membrane protein